MRNRWMAFVALLTLLLPTKGLWAQTPVNVTTTAVPFLSISPDARSAGMGDLGIATDATDVYGGMHNAAKVPFSSDAGGIGVSYTPWLRDVVQGMYLLSAAGYRQLDAYSGFSAGVRYFSLGDVGISDYNGNLLTTSHPREYSLEAGYSRKLSAVLGIGLTGRYIHSDLGSGGIEGTTYKAANAAAVDVSMYYDGRGVGPGGGIGGLGSGGSGAGAGWTAGLTASNLGSRVSYSNDATAKDYLPAVLGLGVAYTGVVDEDNRWMVGVEGNKLLVPAVPGDSAGLANYHSMSLTKSYGRSFSNPAYTFNAGVEYCYKGLLFLRAGYVAETAAAGDLRYATAGVGLRYTALGIDFSYLAPSGSGVTRSAVSNTFRLGLIFHLGVRHGAIGK